MDVETGSDRLTMRRGSFEVHVNLAAAPAWFAVPEDAQVVLTWDRVEISGGALELPPDGVAIVRVGPG